MSRRTRLSRTDSARSARVTVSAVERVFASSAAMRGGTQSLAARRRSCSSVRLPDMGVSELVGSGCAVRNLRLARVRASGLVASLRNEAVASVAIVCPSTQQPCSSSTSVKRYGGATRRQWRRIPGQRRPRRRSAAMRAVTTKSLILWPRTCWPEGCFFGHWRSGTTFSLATGGATRRAVRKHRAPKGALRQARSHCPLLRVSTGQRAPSAKRCIKTPCRSSDNGNTIFRQKAPSAKRCIKTCCRQNCKE